MAKKDPKKEKEGDAFSDSAEIFEDIFKEATQSIKKPQQGSQPTTGRGQGTASRKPALSKPQPTGKARPVSPPQRISEIEIGRKPKRPVSILKIGILTFLLLILGGAVLNYLGVVDVTAAIDLFGLGKKAVVQAPPPKRPPAKSPAKAPSQPDQKQGGEKVAAAPETRTPAPSAVPPKKEPLPPSVPKQEPAKAEAPAPIVQKHPQQEAVGQEPPAPVQQVQPKVQAPPPQASHEVATPVPAPPEPRPVSPPTPPPAPAVAQVQPQQRPAPVQPAPQAAPQGQPKPKAQPPAQQVRPPAPGGTSAKPAPAEGTLPQDSLKYPYSVYLGSYQSVETAKKVISLHKQEDLPAYWSRVHLGEKGTWYRIFAGYFRSEAEAAGWIARKQIKDAEVKKTMYAVLIGVYGSREEAKKRAGELFNLGFSAYVVPEAGSKFRLYTGAFITKEGADINAAELASKGIRSQAMER